MKKRLAGMLGLVLVFILATGPASVLAQDGDNDDEWLEFISGDETLMASYPPGWSIEESLDLPGFTVANSEEVLVAIMEGTDPDLPAPGDQALQVLLLPVDLMTMSGLEITEDTTLEELTVLLVQGLLGLGIDEESSTRVGDVEIVELGDDIEAGVVSLADEVDESEGMLSVVELGDGVLSVGIGLAYLGEYDEDVQAAFYGVLASVDYEGTGADLLALMMGGPPPSDTETDMGDTESMEPEPTVEVEEVEEAE